MKKILAIILALLMALVPMSTLAAKSPTVGCMIRSQPAITYHLVNYDDSFAALLSDLKVDMDLDALCAEYIDGEWSLDEALYIEVAEKYEIVKWRLMPEYNKDQAVAMLLVGDQTGAHIFQWGTVCEDGDVEFDFSEVEPDIYYMFVISGKGRID